MKKLLLLCSLVTISVCALAQNKAILNLPIPHYKILKADSTYSSWTALNKNKPVLLIYFSPDCPHCQHLANEMHEKMDAFNGIQIVMICDSRTEYPYLRMIKDFSRDYDLSKFKNITLGTENGSLAVVNYYKILTTPFIAIYDKNGKMTKYFDKPAKIEDIIAAVKKI